MMENSSSFVLSETFAVVIKIGYANITVNQKIYKLLNRTRGMVPYMGPIFYRLRSRLCIYANINNQLAYSGSLES